MSATAVQFQDVTVELGEHVALENISFAIPEGAFLAVLGPNGAGKSTLLKVILGLIQPTKGTARVFDGAPHRLDRSRAGYVPQVKTLDRSFPALSIELVVTGLRGTWPARVTAGERRRALEALERVGAAHLADHSIGRLSGGELQRVYLARSFARSPSLVLLDEPAQGMDIAGEADMLNLLENYQQNAGATVVMITHDWEAAYHHASHVLIINRRLVSFGTPDKALRDEHFRQAFGHMGHKHAMAIGFKEHD